MSYKYSSGAQVIGDLKAADDTQRDTLIDFGEDQIDLQTSGSVRLQTNNNGMNLYHNPLDLSNNTGVGEIVKFGSGTLTAGKLYFLWHRPLISDNTSVP